MGTCGGKSKQKKTVWVELSPDILAKFSNKCFQKIFNIFNSLKRKLVQIQELSILKLVYIDLASRDKNKKLTKETFSSFFNMIGLWGEKVFDLFDKMHDKQITFEEFVSGIEYYIKSSDKERIWHLFQLYDLHNLNGIKKEDFLQMLYNYPKEEIKIILDDQQFLEEQDIMKAYEQQDKRRKRKIKPRKVSDELSQNQFVVISKNQNRDLQNQGKLDFEKIEGFEDAIIKAKSNESNVNQSSRNQSFNILFPSQSGIDSNGVPLGGFGCNISFEFKGQRIELKMINLNQLIKKYVENVYKQKSSESEELLNLEDFQNFVNKHPKLLSQLYKGFHHELWGYDINTKQPLFKNLSIFAKGMLQKQSRKIQGKISDRYCELVDHFFLEFIKTDQHREIPHKIICLDGLTVIERVDLENKKWGFEVFHKDRIYNTKTYFAKSSEQYNEWTSVLQAYQKADIQENYSIQEKIGDGRFSIVYKCQSKKTKQYFALKIIEKFKLNQEEKQILAHETEIMRLLNHPCVVKLEETIENKTHWYIITELVTDGDLFDYIQKNQYLSEDEAALIMSQLIEAIEYIHSVGIVHRDLKPENIMIIKDPLSKQIKQVKIIDFGFANFLKNLEDNSIDKGLCGTPNYLAPETLLNVQVSFKVDNFALGAIMYLMISGFLPFDSDYPDDIIRNTIEGTYEIDDEFWQCVSEEAKNLIERLLKTDPDQRISLKEVMDHPWLKKQTELEKQSSQLISQKKKSKLTKFQQIDSQNCQKIHAQEQYLKV